MEVLLRIFNKEHLIIYQMYIDKKGKRNKN